MLLQTLQTKLEKANQHLNNLVKRHASRLMIVKATFKILKLETQIEALETMETQTQPAPESHINLTNIICDFKLETGSNRVSLWEKDGISRYYLGRWNGRRNNQYGYLQMTEEGLVLSQQSATASGSIPDMRRVLVREKIPFTYKVCGQVQKVYTF